MKNVLKIVVIAMVYMLPSVANSQNLHYPTKVVSPGFTEKGEGFFTIDVKPSVDFDFDLFDGASMALNIHPGIHFAYSPMEHIVAYGSYNWLVNHNNTVTSINYMDNTGNDYGSKAEIGGGYYTTYGNAGFVEILGSYANGGINHANSSFYTTDQYSQYVHMNGDYNGRYHCFGLQASTGISKRGFSIKGGLKYSAQVYYSFAYRESNTNLYAAPAMKQSAINNNVNSYLQPYFDLIGGGKLFLFNVQVGIMSRIEGNAINTGEEFYYCTLGLGLRHKPSLNNR